MCKEAVMPKKRAVSAKRPSDSPRARAHALVDALPDPAVQTLLPYLEFLKHDSVAAVARQTPKNAPQDSMRRDMGL